MFNKLKYKVQSQYFWYHKKFEVSQPESDPKYPEPDSHNFELKPDLT